MNREIILDQPSVIDLTKYDQSHFDRGKPQWFIIIWWFIQAVTFPLTLHNFSSFRCWLLRLFGAKIGQGVVIRPSARVTYPWKVSIGDYSWIGEDVVLYSLDEIEIGSHCVISQKSYLCTGSHDMQDRAFGLITAPIKIGNGAWIATDCLIAPGVKIGSNAVIGAKSGVFNDIPHSQVAWGIPCIPHYAREIKN